MGAATEGKLMRPKRTNLQFFILASALAVSCSSFVIAEEIAKPSDNDEQVDLDEDHICGNFRDKPRPLMDERPFDSLIRRGEIERTDRIFALRAREQRSDDENIELGLLESLKYKFYPTMVFKEGSTGVLRRNSERSYSGLFQNYKAASVLVLKILGKNSMVVDIGKRQILVEEYPTDKITVGEKYILDAVFECLGNREFKNEGITKEILSIKQIKLEATQEKK
jgi:hypothetical protein